MRPGVSVVVGAACAVAATPAAAAPKIDQLVVYPSGNADQQPLKAAAAKAHVGGKTCSVGAGTALAALLRSGIPGIRLKDFGSCGKRPADAGGLYVSRIRKDAAKGVNGWVYKLGNKVGTTGAADPSGPFGDGLLKANARVTWFYCRMKAKGCQRTLAIKPEALGGGRLRVTVRGYDDRGKPRLTRGAAVHAGEATATTDSKGVATLTVPPGTTRVHAEAKGLVRSFEERIDVE